MVRIDSLESKLAYFETEKRESEILKILKNISEILPQLSLKTWSSRIEWKKKGGVMELEQSFWKQTLFIKYPDKTLLAINFSNTYATIL